MGIPDTTNRKGHEKKGKQIGKRYEKKLGPLVHAALQVTQVGESQLDLTARENEVFWDRGPKQMDAGM